ncbi:hypothetical protein RVBP21_2430 [Pseudomonas phage BRkr]|nr:hypothetical protein RVBP21_2430 [Pseudomonas phage BRkr]
MFEALLTIDGREILLPITDLFNETDGIIPIALSFTTVLPADRADVEEEQ